MREKNIHISYIKRMKNSDESNIIKGLSNIVGQENQFSQN